MTAIEKRLYQGNPSAIQVDWTQNGMTMSDLFVRFPFRDDALRHMLALWNRGERGSHDHQPSCSPTTSTLALLCSIKSQLSQFPLNEGMPVAAL